MRGALCLFFALSLWGAEDPRLAKLRGMIAAMAARPDPKAPRGATPALTSMKTLLREWIESRLAEQGFAADGSMLAHFWNKEIENAQLRTMIIRRPPNPFETTVGRVGMISVERQEQIFLIVTTRLAIQCGEDESVYVYRWTLGRWQLALSAETNDYSSEARYRPQTITSVSISTPAREGPGFEDRLVLILGTNPWCSSTWHPLYHRVWRLRSDRSPSEFLGGGDSIAKIDRRMPGAAAPREVLFEFWTWGLGGYHRQEVKRLALEGHRLVRRDPVALRPLDFVVWWLESPWAEVEPWTEPKAWAAAKNVHPLGGADRFWENVGLTHWCPKEPDLWQVHLTIASTRLSPAENPPPQHWYFVLRWRPPYRFSLVDVSNQRRAGCTQEDPEAEAVRTLFPPVP